jgi:integrase
MARPRLPIGTAGRLKVVKEGPRTWRATCRFRDYDGVVRKIRRWAQTQTEAGNKVKEAIRDRQVQGLDISANTKVPDVYNLWLAEFKTQVDRGARSGTSLDTYENRWKLLYPRVKDFTITELNAGRADRILQDINSQYARSTAKTCRSILSGLCGVAVRHGVYQVNPVRDARPLEESKKRKKAPRALEVAEVLHILTLFDQDEIAVRQDLPDIARWLAGSGNRTGEMLAVRWERIDFTAKVAYVDHNAVWIKGEGLVLNDGKTEMADREIALADWLADMLLDRRRRVAALHGIEPEQITGWVFPNINGDLRYSSNLRRDWRAFRDRHQDELGDWFTPRTFRRTVATLLTDQLPAREASDMLGHSKVSQTTDTYVGRKMISRRPAEVLAVFGQSKKDSKRAPRSEND